MSANNLSTGKIWQRRAKIRRDSAVLNSGRGSAITITNQYKGKAEDKGRNASPNNYLLLVIETE
ncbi:MAG TPA: hypothetical protein VIQ31_37805 [Phormidium sp.]